eukprot:Lithocolla_globosa_v1_NODE_1080_length_2888_cov_52.579245.p2 type:complete len:431 gc:universal NODE_1080_length_2888_cov_52.579245:1466-174(-)
MVNWTSPVWRKRIVLIGSLLAAGLACVVSTLSLFLFGFNFNITVLLFLMQMPALVVISSNVYENFVSVKTPYFSRWIPKRIGTEKTGLTYLVTGGGGFVGGHMVEALLARGETQIVVFDLYPRENYPKDVKYIKGNLCDQEAVEKATKNVDVVFHIAALVDFWSQYPFERQRLYNVNVVGTRNVIEACKKNKVKKLIDLSSATVAYDLKASSLLNMRETDLPKGPFVSCYSEVKGLAETEVLAAAKSGLLTGAVRPIQVAGPNDIPTTIYLNWALNDIPGFIVDSNNLFEPIYVENVVHSLLCFERSLTGPSSPCNGQAYFITNGPAMKFNDYTKKVADSFNLTAVFLPLTPVLRVVASVVDKIRYISGGKLGGSFSTPAYLMAFSEWTLDDTRARKEIGYTPLYPMHEVFDAYTSMYDEARDMMRKKNQ